jgi:hypothetical protein
VSHGLAASGLSVVEAAVAAGGGRSQGPGAGDVEEDPANLAPFSMINNGPRRVIDVGLMVH